MHCNLRQPVAAQSLYASISSPVPSSKSLIQSVAFLERFYCLYVTLRCDLDLWPLTLNICGEAAMPWWNSVRNLSSIGQSRRSYCSLNFDLMTLNMYHVLRYALRYFTQSLNSIKLSVHEMWRLFHANTSCHAMTLTFDPLTLKVCGC